MFRAKNSEASSAVSFGIETKGKEIEPRTKIVSGDFVDLDEIVKRREILQESDISKYNDSLAR